MSRWPPMGQILILMKIYTDYFNVWPCAAAFPQVWISVLCKCYILPTGTLVLSSAVLLHVKVLRTNNKEFVPQLSLANTLHLLYTCIKRYSLRSSNEIMHEKWSMKEAHIYSRAHVSNNKSEAGLIFTCIKSSHTYKRFYVQSVQGFKPLRNNKKELKCHF